jgi:hypothetical protein
MGTRWKELAGDAGLLGEDTFLNGDASIASQVTRITSLPDIAALLVSLECTCPAKAESLRSRKSRWPRFIRRRRNRHFN